MKGPAMSDVGSPPYGAGNLFTTPSGISGEVDFMNMKAFSNSRPAKPTMDPRTDANIDPSFFQESGSMPGWASDINFAPLSPPASASLDSKWDYGFPSFPTTTGFPGLSTPNARSQFGQITPPSDETEAKLSLEQDLEDQSDLATLQPPQQQPSESSTDTGAKRTRGKTGKESPAKRSRRYGSRNGESSKAGKTEDVRRSKFLERNRVAASKCRQKKKEWTQNLETRAREMQKESGIMRMAVDSLRDEVLWLKGELLKHHSCDCVEIQTFMKSHAHNLALEQDQDQESVAGPQLKREDGSASPRIGSDLDETSSLAERRSMADDDSVLEALLTNSINQESADALSHDGGD